MFVDVNYAFVINNQEYVGTAHMSYDIWQSKERLYIMWQIIQNQGTNENQRQKEY